MKATSEQELDDNYLMHLLNRHTTIDQFLDCIFGFLCRRTDFFIKSTDNVKDFGFKNGDADKLLKMTYTRWESLANMNATENSTSVSESSYNPTNSENIYTNSDSELNDGDLESDKEDDSTYFEEIPIEEMPLVFHEEVIEYDEIEEDEEDEDEDEEDEDEDPIEIEKSKFQPSEHFNGAKFDNYCWSQTESELDIYVLLPSGVTKSNQLNVKVEPDLVSVLERNGSVILDGQLHGRCRSADTLWVISGNKVQITLDKIKNGWWRQCFLTEPLLDPQTISEENSYDEMSEDLRLSMERAQWNQQQMMNGLATEEEIQKDEQLRRAWNADGSPFKGTPFDRTRLTFS